MTECTVADVGDHIIIRMSNTFSSFISKSMVIFINIVTCALFKRKKFISRVDTWANLEHRIYV